MMDLYNEEAMKEFFFRWKEPVKSTCVKYIRNKEVLKDIVPEILIKLWQARDRVEKAKNPNGYVFRTAKNHCLDHLQKASGQEKYIEPAEAEMAKYTDDVNAWFADQRAGVYKELRMQLLNEAMEGLSPQRKKVIHLRYWEGLLPEEIAGRLGIQVSVVYDHLRKALLKLRELLEHKGLRSLLVILPASALYFLKIILS